MNNKVIPYIFIASSICWYVVAIINFVNGNHGMGGMFMCLGASWMCLSTVFASKNKKTKENEDTKGEEHEKD